MSVKDARTKLSEFAASLDAVVHRKNDLERQVLEKSDTLSRLEQARQAPVSQTVALVQLQRSRITLGDVKLKPTQTKVASSAAAFPAVEEESSEASEIKPWLFLAGNIVARDANKIRAKGITRVLNAAHTVCPNYFEGEFEYTSFDLIDHPSESIDHFLLNGIAEIERAREDGKKILVHCHQGVSRSATLVTAYIAWKDNLSIMDALMYVKARRKVVCPNSGFMDQLNSFEPRLRSVITTAALYNVAPHSEQVPTLVVKQIYDRNRPLIDEDDVFLLFEGHGGDLLIRIPKIASDPRLMETAQKVAGWMIKYETTFKTARIIVVPYDDERFLTGLKRVEDRPN